MGVFSWNTQDTNRSISCNPSIRETFHVEMIDNKGNVWKEDDYEGYGVFGGKDYYELLAEMNGYTSDLKGNEYTRDIRLIGIDLELGKNDKNKIFFPNLIENSNYWEYRKEGPKDCKYQGYFYYDDDDIFDDDNY